MCRCPTVTPPGKLGSPSNLNPGDSEPGKKATKRRRQAPLTYSLEIGTLENKPRTKEKQSKPRKQAPKQLQDKPH